MQFRPDLNLRIHKHVSLTDFNFNDIIEYLKKSDHIVYMILMEDKTILINDQRMSIRRMKIAVVTEKEFLAEILD